MNSIAIDETTKREINTPDFNAIKTRQQATWGSGDYGRIGVTLQITGEQLCEAMDLQPGATVLDVAAGNGNVTLAAARRFCRVISTDYVYALLNQSEKRADAEGLSVTYQEADAENLPFANEQFDNVVSTFGVMFTPDQARSAAELLRVCRPGGKIGMANWTPDGFIGSLFKTIGRYVPPPAGISSPALWGTKAFIENHFGHSATSIEANTRYFNFRYQSPEHWLDLFSTYYGPVLKTFAALDDKAANQLRADIFQLIAQYNQAEDGTMKVPSEYLEVVITR